MRRQEIIKTVEHSTVRGVNLGARNTPNASRKCQERLSSHPGFIEEERIRPNNQKKYQDLMLNCAEIQKGSV
jgi:hypothetical protein